MAAFVVGSEVESAVWGRGKVIGPGSADDKLRVRFGETEINVFVHRLSDPNAKQKAMGALSESMANGLATE